MGTGVLVGLSLSGCGTGGGQTNDRNTIVSESPNSGIAGPVSGNLGSAFNSAPLAESVPRDRFGRANELGSLTFPLTRDEMAHASRGLAIFNDPRLSNDSGVGPYFNQRNCLGCHTAQQPGLVPTPASRARTEDGAFQYGDFNPATLGYDPRTDAGGPFLHAQMLPGFPPVDMPPVNAGMVRVTHTIDAPPYIGRGLMEAVPDDEILLNDDPYGNGVNGPGIQSMENRNPESIPGFVGASTTVRLARFGLRGQGPTLLQFMLAGLTAEIGITSPFTPNENTLADHDDPVPEPEASAQDVRDLLTFTRMTAPPTRDLDVGPGSPNPQTPPANGTDRLSVENRGRVLFGVDYNNPPFGVRKPPSSAKSAMDLLNDPAGPNFNCAGCHTPVMITGQSPADVGAAHLSNKKFFPFSDMLMHHMGTVDTDDVLFATGRALPDQWRTPPLMGIGLIGPPFYHDGRVPAGLSLSDALDRAIRLHDSPGSEAQISAQAYELLDQRGGMTVNGVTYKADDVIAFMQGL